MPPERISWNNKYLGQIKTHGTRKGPAKGVGVHYGSKYPIDPLVKALKKTNPRLGYVAAIYNGIAFELADPQKIVYHMAGKNTDTIGLAIVYPGPSDRKMEGGIQGWHPRHKRQMWFPPYNDEDIVTAALVVRHWKSKGLCGDLVLYHDDVDPSRKCDPGPAFPRELFENIIKHGL